MIKLFMNMARILFFPVIIQCIYVNCEYYVFLGIENKYKFSQLVYNFNALQ